MKTDSKSKVVKILFRILIICRSSIVEMICLIPRVSDRYPKLKSEILTVVCHLTIPSSRTPLLKEYHSFY